MPRSLAAAYLGLLLLGRGTVLAVNATTIAALGLFALSASASIFLILELSQPFTGIMMISSEPLRNALAPLGA
jgi:hypothetical protein